MSGYNDTGTKTFQASEAIGKNILVKLSTGKVAISGAGDRPIGVTRNSVAINEYVAVDLLSKQGTILMTADDAVTAGAVLYGNAAGKVDDADTGSDKTVGVALEAATADGDLIEVIPRLSVE